jgi:hypothetical protein
MTELSHSAAITAPETLPRLIARAAADLAKATTAAEYLEVCAKAGFVYTAGKKMARIAKAKEAHDEIIAACHNAMRDALLIEARAQCRLADEYDAAQARGEVASHSGGNPKIVTNKNDLPPTAADLGFKRQEIFIARRTRDAEKADPGIIQRTLDELVAAGKEPTRANLKRATRPKPSSLNADEDDDEEDYEEEEEDYEDDDEEDYEWKCTREAFMGRAHSAWLTANADRALYTGPVDEGLIEAACRVADAWLELARKLRDDPHQSYCLCPLCKGHNPEDPNNK